MISSRVLNDILEKPLGPYHDHCILSETCQMKSGTKLVLYSFILEHNGRVIGLDESERPLDGPDNRKFRFRGVFKITDPDWLSDAGLKTIETELNLRFRERALHEGQRPPQQPLTLEGLFKRNGLLARSDDATWHKDDESKLMVKIQGEKNMPALFMTSDVVPNGLLWSSKAHNRNYQVATMDVETYSLSQDFFWRWRLLALMKKICDQHCRFPLNKRTPAWFVDKYLAGYACTPEHKHRRLIYDEDDPDIDDKGKTITPRFLRKPHMSEMLGLFAAHAEWLIANNEVKRKKLFDIGPWESFVRNAKKQRREAFIEGVRWGWPEGKEDESSSEGSEGYMGRRTLDTDKLARKNPVIGKPKEVLDRKLQLAKAKSERERGNKRLVVSSDSASEGDVPDGPEYVSDFSEPSDSEEYDSDHLLADVEALDQIPWQLKLPPQLPDVDGRWRCPSQGCDYHVNLHKLKEEDIKGVAADRGVRHIQQIQWRNAPYDEKVLQGFKSIITDHYLKHFEECGVRVEKREEKPQQRFVSISGRRKHRGGDEEPIRGPMPARGTLGGESRVIPIVHAPQA